MILLFARRRAELERRLPAARDRRKKDGGLWIVWPKGRVAEVTESVARAAGRAAGLVDNKVCAVDEVWSGLRVVYRLKDR